MVWWEEAKLKPDDTRLNQTRVVFTPTNHWSRRGVFDENKALWGSWAIIGKDGNKFWFGGDTGYSDVFKQIGRRFGPFQLSAIPIGAYNPRATMKYFHVNTDEAVKIHEDINSEKSLGTLLKDSYQYGNSVKKMTYIYILNGKYYFSIGTVRKNVPNGAY